MMDNGASEQSALVGHLSAHLDTLSKTAADAHDDLHAYEEGQPGRDLPAEELADLQENLLIVQSRLQSIQTHLEQHREE